MRRDPLGADQQVDAVTGGGAPVEVSGVLSELAQARGWAPRLRGAQVHDVWQEAAGDDLARHVRPVRLHGGVLVLEASSSGWATQVRYLTADLARRLNEALGGELVSQVRVVTQRGSRPG